MKTQKPLVELVPDMLKHIQSHYDSHIVYNSILIDISNGNLLPYVQESMREELNPRAYDISKNRIPPINVLKKLQIKLSKVYAEDPEREAGENDIDKDLLSHYVSNWGLNDNLQYVNELLVINKYAALEPYMNDGIPDMRVLSAKDFIVYSDSTVNPNEMTVFIKFMGNIQKQIRTKTSGLSGSTPDTKTVAIFHAYSDDEFIIFDEDGEILDQKENPFGIIPFVYIRTNPNQLIPTPDSDSLPITLLIPKLLTDLNYAVMFGARSQIVGIDVELDNVEFSPDAIWMVNSQEGDNKNPSISTIKSDVDIEKVVELINTELSLFLDTRGISTGSIGKSTIQNSASGISKLIDESDATSVNRSLKKTFKKVERSLFKKLPIMHDTWMSTGELTEIRTMFSKDFNPTTIIQDAKVIPNTKEILEEMKIMDELGIFSKRKGLQKLNPELDPTQIETLLNEIEESDRIDITIPEIEENEE